MKINIVSFGKMRDRSLVELADYYAKIIGKYANVTRRSLPDRAEEKIRWDDVADEFSHVFPVVLTPRGREFTTEEFSTKLGQWSDEGQHIHFFVGNAFGFTDEVETHAKMLLSLSRMTFSHEMSTVILMEQLYRCLNLKAGGKYHKT